MKTNVRALVIYVAAVFMPAYVQLSSASGKIGRSDTLCKSIGDAARAPFKEVLQKRVHEAIAQHDWPRIHGLIWDGADPNWLRNTRWYRRAVQDTLNRDLVHASAIGDQRLIERLILEGADVNAQAHYDENMSALIWAARCDQASAVRLLLDKGADVNIKGDVPGISSGLALGSTPLIWAASNGNIDVAKILLARGANPNARETIIDDTNKAVQRRNGPTPLTVSANREITELLLRDGADPNLVGSNNMSPLMAGAFRGDLEQCKLLLESGANPRLQDAFGQTAADWADQAGHREIAELLRDAR